MNWGTMTDGSRRFIRNKASFRSGNKGSTGQNSIQLKIDVQSHIQSEEMEVIDRFICCQPGTVVADVCREPDSPQLVTETTVINGKSPAGLRDAGSQNCRADVGLSSLVSMKYDQNRSAYLR